MKYSLPLLLATMLLMVVGCKPTVPSEYIQPDEMEDILYDYYLAQALARNDFGQDIDTKRNVYFMAVLEKHHVTEAEFDSSLVYYYSRLEKLRDIYGHVNERLGEEAERMGTAVGARQYSQYGTSGDTANIWTGVSDVLLIPFATMNRFDFQVKADTTFRLGDSFMFQFKSEAIWQRGNQNAVVCITAYYANDSIAQHYLTVSTSGNTQVRVPSYKDSPLKRLRGFIYVGSDDSDDARRLLFVSQIQLIRFHEKVTIPTPDETDEENEKDSLQRVANPRGGVADTASRPVGSGLRSKHAPFRKGGGRN